MNCSKCHSEFNCNKEDITSCHCYPFNFKKGTKDFISKHYDDCLCNKCLHQFKQFELLEKKEIFGVNNTIELKENIHYYVENSLWVFTEYYHFLKGSCCLNNCRHCIYNYND